MIGVGLTTSGRREPGPRSSSSTRRRVTWATPARPLSTGLRDRGRRHPGHIERWWRPSSRRRGRPRRCGWCPINTPGHRRRKCRAPGPRPRPVPRRADRGRAKGAGTTCARVRPGLRKALGPDQRSRLATSCADRAGHGGRQEQTTDDGDAEQHGDRHADADLLDGRQLTEGEPRDSTMPMESAAVTITGPAAMMLASTARSLAP